MVTYTMEYMVVKSKIQNLRKEQEKKRLGLTLWYQIIVQQILLFFWQNAYLHALISSYTIIYFWKKILPTHLFHPTQLFLSFKNKILVNKPY